MYKCKFDPVFVKKIFLMKIFVPPNNLHDISIGHNKMPDKLSKNMVYT